MKTLTTLLNKLALTAMSLTGGTEIAANTDLDGMLTPGNYYSPSGTNSVTLKNPPTTTAGFRMWVGYTCAPVSKTWMFQRATDTRGNEYIREKQGSAAWSEWRKTLSDSSSFLVIECGDTALNTAQKADYSVTDVKFTKEFKTVKSVVVGLRSVTTSPSVGNATVVVKSGSITTKGFSIVLLNNATGEFSPAAEWIAIGER